MLKYIKDKDVLKGDIESIAEWLDTDVDNLKLTFKMEPIAKFKKQIIEMLGTYYEFPKDAKRTKKIVGLINKTKEVYPIFAEPEHLFVMEGRHRMVAFWQLDLKEIPVFYCEKVK